MTASAIESVLVSEDRAHVVRRAKVSLSAGMSKLTFEGVAPVIVDKTLRVVCPSATVASAVVRRRRVESVQGGAAMKEQARALDEEIARQVRATEMAASTVKRLVWKIDAHDVAARNALRELSEDAGAGTARPDAAKIFTSIEVEEKRTRAEHVTATIAATEAQRQLHRLRARRAALDATQSHAEATIEVVLSCEAPLEGVLTMEYIVPGACWRPCHTATLSKGKLTLTAEACVWQATGEDWTDATLRVSTERPSLGKTPPALSDDVVSVQRKQEIIRVEKREIEIDDAGLGGAATKPRVPGIDDGGDVRVLDAGKVSVPSDGRPHKTMLFRMESDATTELVCMPELATSAIEKTTQTNRAKQPLLAGPVELVKESGFVGRTEIAFIAPGERFELGWGPEPGVRIRRDVEVVTVEQGLLPTSWAGKQNRVSIHVSSIDDRKRTVLVTERIPVSEIEKVEITVDAKETKPTATPDEDGFMKWSVELGPHGRKSLHLRYVVRHHRDVTGL